MYKIVPATHQIMRINGHCSNCFTPLRPEAKFCQRCRGQVMEIKKVPLHPEAHLHGIDPARPNFCRCHFPLPEGETICPRSGIPIAF